MKLLARSFGYGVRRATPDAGSWTLANVHVPELLRRSPLNLGILVGLGSAQLLALTALTQPFKLHYLPIMLGMYLWLGFSVTFYLHRYLTHRGFETVGWIKLLGALGAVIGLSGDPVGWVGDHRHHHRATERPNDLHSPRHLGFWMAHWGWIFRDLSEFSSRTRELAKDVRVYPYARALEHPALMVLPHLMVASLFLGFMGFGAMVWCLYVPIFLLNHMTWCINSVCHRRWAGYRNFATDDDSVNVPVLAVLALGEGNHNNHHQDGRRASHGLHWYELDPTKYLIWGLSKVGLVRDVHW